MTTVSLASDIYNRGGTPLLILHGLLGAARNWMAIAKRLGEEYEVHVIDLRNHGRSPWIDGMAYDVIANDVARYISEKGLIRPAILGHSMGGKTAMALALTHPEKVDRLLVADIAPVPYGRARRSSFLDYIEGMAAIELSGILRRAEADRILEPVIPEKGVRAFLLQNLIPDGDGFRWRCNLEALANGMADIIDFPDKLLEARYSSGPVLFLTGELSDYVRPEHRPIIRSTFPNARFASLKGAGHWLHADQPRSFIAAVRQFMAAPSNKPQVRD